MLALLVGLAYPLPIKQFARRLKARWRALHAEKSLWYEALPILSFSRAEFAAFLRTNGLAPVHLGLDDPILTRYQVLRIRLWNEATAVSQPPRFQAVVVDAAQESETRRLLESKSVRVYTEQDLEFLQGSVRFSLPEGIDSGSEVEVQVYVKASPGVPIIPSLETAADTKLALRRKGAAPRLVVDEPRGATSPELSLTPPVAHDRMGNPARSIVLNASLRDRIPGGAVWRRVE